MEYYDNALAQIGCIPREFSAVPLEEGDVFVEFLGGEVGHAVVKGRLHPLEMELVRRIIGAELAAPSFINSIGYPQFEGRGLYE